MQTKQCTNPIDDMEKQNEMLNRGRCKSSPIVRSGHVYTYSAACKMQAPSETSKSVLTDEGDSACTIRVDSDVGGETTRGLLSARRIGDWPR